MQCREGAHVRAEGGGGHAGRNRRNVIGIVNSLLLVVLVLLIKVVMGVNVLLRGVLSARKRKVIGVIGKAQVGVHVRLVDAEASPYTGEKLRIGEEALVSTLATLGVIGVMGLVGHFQCGQHGHRRH